MIVLVVIVAVIVLEIEPMRFALEQVGGFERPARQQREQRRLQVQL